MKKFILTAGVLLPVSFLLILTVFSLPRTYGASPSLILPDVSAGGFFNNLPSPIQNFINSAKQIGGNLIGGAAGFHIQSFTFNATGIWNKINFWFGETTGGVNLIQIVKTVGNLFIWVLTAATNLLKWLLSLI